MGELFEEVKQKILDKLNDLSTKQKLILLSSIVFTVMMFGVIYLWSSQPAYSSLYSGLTEKDASKVVDKLRDLKIDYKLEANRVLIPKSEIHSVRLEMAKEGLPSTSGTGYEIFDQVNIGMTEFLQKLNYRRALETELSRTISSMDEVNGARVHIVIPDDALFLEDKKEPTASIILNQKRSMGLNDEQVQGITYLISSAVEGLRVNNISIIDKSGRILNKKMDENSLYASSATQLEIKKSLEGYLRSKVQTMLNSVLGYGNAIVQVDAELDFTKIDQVVQKFDPESQVTISESVKEKESSNASQTNQPNSQSRDNNTISNYETNKVTQNIIGETGNIKRLSASVLINDKYVTKTDENGDEVKTYEKWPDQEINRFSEIVKSAIGFNLNRGDFINVNNITFEPVVSYKEEEPSLFVEVMDNLGTRILIIIAALGAILIVRSIINAVRDTQTRIDGEKRRQVEDARNKVEEERILLESDVSAESSEGANRLKAILDKSDEMPEELLMRQEIHNRISEYIQDKPVESVNLLKSWIMQEEE